LNRGRWIFWVALAAVWFATVPVRPLLDPDEGRYSEIPREMVGSGDWVTPRLDALKYFEKPPLQYWATAALYSVFGQSEWTARLWTVGLAFLCLPVVFAWTTRLYGAQAGLAALVALAVSPYFGIVGHLNLLDAGFTFWLSSTVFAFALAQSAPVGSQSERRWMMAAWIGAALSILSKGIVVGVLAGGTLIAYTLLERDLRPWQRLHLLRGLPVFLLIAAPWFIVVSLRNPEFPGFFFVHEHFARFLTTVHQRVEPWWYFLPILLIGTLPWVASVVSAGRRVWFDSSPDIPFKPLKFLIIFSLVTLAFFSASGSKLAPYVLPIMPSLAAIAGAQASRRPHFVRRAAQVGGVFMLFICAGLAVYTLRRNGFVPPTATPWVLVGASAALIGLAAAWRAPSGLRLVWVTAATAILGWQCLLSGYTEIPPHRSAQPMLMAVTPLIHPETELFSLGQYRQTISPYLRRTLTLVDFRGELDLGLTQEPAKQPTPDEFLARWRDTRDAIVFLDPARLDYWRGRGLEGRVVAKDDDTVAVSRL